MRYRVPLIVFPIAVRSSADPFPCSNRIRAFFSIRPPARFAGFRPPAQSKPAWIGPGGNVCIFGPSFAPGIAIGKAPRSHLPKLYNCAITITAWQRPLLRCHISTFRVLIWHALCGCAKPLSGAVVSNIVRRHLFAVKRPILARCNAWSTASSWRAQSRLNARVPVSNEYLSQNIFPDYSPLFATHAILDCSIAVRKLKTLIQ
jgi:hypothetical protein